MSDNCRDLFFTETTATALGTYSAYIGDGVNTTYNITHNLNSEEVTYSLRDVQTDVLGYAQVNVTGPNTVTISFDDPPALTAFYLTIFASITAKQVTGFEDRITVNVTQPVQDISVNVADTSDVILVSPEQDVITISTSVQSAPGVTIDVGVVDTQEQINVAVDTAATAWGTIIGTLSTQTDLWRYLSAETFSPSQLTALLNSNAISLCSINVNGTILSAGTDLFDIFLTSETDSQTLSYIASSYLLSISNGNTVNLSSINSVFAANSGKYESVYSNVQSNSANWNSATTVVQQGSSNWYSASSSAISYTHQNFLPLSGGTIAGSLYVLSSVYVAGSAFYINAQDLIVSDPIVYIAEGNQTDFLDIGIIASWTNPPGYPVGYQHGGLIRRSDNKTWTLFSGASSEPLSGLNVEWSQQGIVLEPLSAKFYGDIYGNRFVYGSLSATGSVFGSNLNISNWNQAYNTATVYQTNSATYAPKVELRSHSMFSSGDYAVQQGRNVELSFSANASNTNITITLPRQDSNDNAQTGDELLIRLSSINPINSTVTIRQYTFTGSLPYPGTFTNLITFPAGTPSQTIRLRLGTFIWALLPTPNLFSPTQIGLITPNTGTFTTLSATGVVHASGGNSNLWNSAYNISTAYQSASSQWNLTYETAITSVNNFTGKDITLNNYIYTTTNTNLSSNRKYSFDTLSGSLTATLPQNPNYGDEIELFDVRGVWSTNSLIVVSDNYIEQRQEPLNCNVRFGLIKLIYTNDNIGWRIIPYPRHNVQPILAPNVSIQTDVLSGFTPLAVNFTGVNNLGEDIAPVSTWIWNLTGGNTPQFTTQNVTYTYQTSGTYVVNLTASNSVGTNTASVTVSATTIAIPTNGLLVRFNADSGVTESGGSITSWTDQQNGVVATAFNGPALLTNEFNSRNAVSFDGTNDYFTFTLPTGLTSSQNRTIFVIGKYTNPLGRPQNGMLNSISPSQDRAYVFHNGFTSDAYFFTGSNQYGPAPFTPNAYMVQSIVQRTNGSGFIRVNGVPSADTSANTATDINSFVIGGRSISTERFLGTIVELLIYNRELTTEEIEQVETYANIP